MIFLYLLNINCKIIISYFSLLFLKVDYLRWLSEIFDFFVNRFFKKCFK